MMPLLFKRAVLIISILVFGLAVKNFAQAPQTGISTTDTSNYILYRTTPVWKDMIADTNANYFQVQQAFKLFWSGKELPEEEEEIIGEKRKLKDNLINRTFNAGELKKQQLREALAFDYKRYRWWLIKTEPYVKEDGGIMTPSERLRLWKNHQEELKESNRK